MHEIRILWGGRLYKTTDEKRLPSVRNPMEINSEIVLADHKFKEEEITLIQELKMDEIGIAIHNSFGRLEKLILDGNEILDRALMYKYFRKMNVLQCPFSTYKTENGCTKMLYFITPTNKERILE